MIELTQWRVSVGLWCSSVKILAKNRGNATYTSSGWVESVLSSYNDGGVYQIFFIIVFVALLLILSGDVELNPGPKTDILKEAPNEYDLLHLLADVDYLWFEIGVFFGVDYFILEDLRISIKDDIVKLSEVIYSCVSTTNLLPFTWETVIPVIKQIQTCTSTSDKRKVDQILEHILKENVPYNSILRTRFTTMSTRSQDSEEEATFEMEDEKACLPKRKCTQIDFNKSILRKSPNTPALIHLLADIEYMWHEIGLALEVSLSDLHELKTSNQKNAAKLSRVIQCWMTSANRSFITWETMIFAMEGPIVYRKSTAAKIYAHLGIEGDNEAKAEPQTTTDIIKKTPSDEDILFLLYDMAFEWHEIGQSLQISHDFLNRLSLKKFDNVINLAQVIRKWKTTTNSHCITWETVILAIENLHNFTQYGRYKVLAESSSYKRKVMEIQKYLTKGICSKNSYSMADMLIKESVSLNKMLSKQPTLDELCEQFSVISINWYLFGVHFQLENNQLEAIRQLEKKVVYKMLKMFKVLLHVKPSTTRKQIIDALYFMDFFAIAEDYINSLIKAHDRTESKNDSLLLYDPIPSTKLPLEDKLNNKPPLSELCEHVILGTMWYMFGVLLKLDTAKLDDIEDLYEDVHLQGIKMFQVWLETNPNATRMQVIFTLQRNSISLIRMSYEYIEIIDCIPVKDLSSQNVEWISPIIEIQDHFKVHCIPSLTNLLEERPPLNELQEHVKIGSKWFLFGVLLNINPTDLSTIEQLNGDSVLKALKMFQIWLDTDPNATRMKVIDTLEKEVIGEMTLATFYMTTLKKKGNLTQNNTKELLIPSMNFSASTLSFDEFLQDRPTHDELCNHIVFCDWRLLAICLPTITDIDVDVIFEETGGISSLALQQTFQLWLKKCPNASRQQVIQILKSRVIGQNAIAAKYESALKELYGNYIHLLEKAMEEGHVVVKWSKFSICGPPKTGKSSFLKLLFGDPPGPCDFHDSTPIVAVHQARKLQIVTAVMKDERSEFLWEILNHETLKTMIAGGINDGIRCPQFAPIQADQPMKDPTNSNFPNEPVEEKFIDLLVDDLAGIEDMDSEPKLDTLGETYQQQFLPVYRDISQRLSHTKKSDKLYESHWIYAIDTGGQAAFLDIAPALLGYHSVNIFTHKLTEQLDDKAKFFYSVKGKIVGEPIVRDITNIQLLEASIRLLSAVHPPKLPNIIEPVKEPCHIVVGTFFDEISKSKESLHDKNERIRSTLEQYQILKHRGKVIFPINTTGRGDCERSMANEIRRKICQYYIKAEIPARWFIFQLELDQFQKRSENKIVSLSMCVEIGKALTMDKAEVNAALMYFHDLTIFLYFDILPSVVFLHPQPLFDLLSDIISISFADDVDSLFDKGISILDDDHEQLKNNGIFKEGLLTCQESHFSYGFSSEFSAKDFLKLMTNLFIFASLPKQKEQDEAKYFVPSILPYFPLNESTLSRFKTYVDPLIITWDMRPLPQGLFPALIVNLLHYEGPINFHLPASGSKLLHSRNAISLRTNNGCVHLIDSNCWMEIYFSGPINKCFTVHNAITEGIFEVMSKFRYLDSKNSPKKVFCCSECPDKQFCYLDDDETLFCYKCLKTSSINEPRRKPWFSEEKTCDVLKKIPNDYELLDLLADISADWQDIGLALKIDDNDLKGISNHAEDSDNYKLFKVIRRWMESKQSSVTWETVIFAIQGPVLNKKQKADDIRKYLGLPMKSL